MSEIFRPGHQDTLMNLLHDRPVPMSSDDSMQNLGTFTESLDAELERLAPKRSSTRTPWTRSSSDSLDAELDKEFAPWPGEENITYRLPGDPVWMDRDQEHGRIYVYVPWGNHQCKCCGEYMKRGKKRVLKRNGWYEVVPQSDSEDEQDSFEAKIKKCKQMKWLRTDESQIPESSGGDAE
jgi:hypothetical protein